MSLTKQIKTAADTIDDLAKDLEASQKKLAAAQSELAATKAAKVTAEGQVKSASAKVEEQKAELAKRAKTAAAALKTAGLLSSDRAADEFASVVLDHGKALEQLTKFASVTPTARRTSRVVVEGQTKTASANDVFEAGLRKYAR